MSTAAAFQLFSTNIERLRLVKYLQLRCLRLQFSSLFSMFSTSTSSVYVSLSLFNQGVYGCPFHVFSKSLFQLESPLILVMAPELTGSSYSYLLVSRNIEAFSLCFVFTSTKISEWSPMERRAPAQGSS